VTWVNIALLLYLHNIYRKLNLNLIVDGPGSSSAFDVHIMPKWRDGRTLRPALIHLLCICIGADSGDSVDSAFSVTGEHLWYNTSSALRSCRRAVVVIMSRVLYSRILPVVTLFSCIFFPAFYPLSLPNPALPLFTHSGDLTFEGYG